jgi:hypothetical protein
MDDQLELCNSCGKWVDSKSGVKVTYNKECDFLWLKMPYTPINICSANCLIKWVEFLRSTNQDF